MQQLKDRLSLSLYIYIYLPTYLSTYLSIYLSIYQSINQSIICCSKKYFANRGQTLRSFQSGYLHGEGSCRRKVTARNPMKSHEVPLELMIPFANQTWLENHQPVMVAYENRL